ncbi:hypothetical protein HPP92_002590 [Vanilla planifolia]|uniref:Uncharacterized protein n=1 Tax=Vanilla planifolia TaxID=51239 RepID=A0A835SF01_VANPL|nr:hypothetical protein HPP92_002980 [Vanilla planifolia]KAG0502518.1 hypothetical protein HPP92_002590 [Vanilla planifolia]
MAAAAVAATLMPGSSIHGRNIRLRSSRRVVPRTLPSVHAVRVKALLFFFMPMLNDLMAVGDNIDYRVLIHRRSIELRSGFVVLWTLPSDRLAKV